MSARTLRSGIAARSVSQTPIAVDLFCGVGGMSLGFEQAGFRVATAIDCDELNTSTHELNFPGVRTICADVRNLSASAIRTASGIGRARIDVVFGGPPCQGFSIGGHRRPKDERNALILEFARLVGELRPKYFVMENVFGLLGSKYSHVLRAFRRTVERAGYLLVQPIRSLNAADFGVPQRRRRAFIVGHLRGMRPPSYPTPSLKRITVADALDDLVCVERSSKVRDGVFFGTLPRPTPYSRLLRRNGGRARKSMPLTGFGKTEHSTATLKRFAGVKPGERDQISKFFRLSREGVAPTLRAGTGFDKGRFMAPRPIHPEFDRCIFLREAARLHSFPDWFSFHQIKWHAFRQIGNSVPPALALAVARKVKEALAEM